MNHIEQNKNQIKNNISSLYGITQPLQKSEINDLEKGGKHGQIGEIRNGYKKVA